MFIEIKEPLKVPEAASEGLRDKGLLWIIGACFLGNALFLGGSILFARVTEARNPQALEKGLLDPAAAGDREKAVAQNAGAQVAAEEPAPPEASALDQLVDANDAPASPLLVSHRKRMRGTCECLAVCTPSVDAAADQAERDQKRIFKPARNKR